MIMLISSADMSKSQAHSQVWLGWHYTAFFSTWSSLVLAEENKGALTVDVHTHLSLHKALMHIHL